MEEIKEKVLIHSTAHRSCPKGQKTVRRSVSALSKLHSKGQSASKVLITGAQGMLGRALLEKAAGSFEVYPTDIGDLDITQKDKVAGRLKEVKPGIIIHAAAYADVDGCEKNPEVAYRVNVEGTRNLVEAARETKSIIIFISTDYVFDGNKKIPYTESDKTGPLGVYGKTKAEAEEIVSQSGLSHLIVRSSFLFGKGKRGFVETIIEQARKNKKVRVVADKYGTPTYVNDLAEAIVFLCGLIRDDKFDFLNNNILHITNSGYCSWIEYAQKAVAFAGVKGVTFFPIKLSEYPFKARRPAFSVLDSSKFQGIYGKSLRPWQEALKEHVQCSGN